jgi:hypothetical protein
MADSTEASGLTDELRAAELRELLESDPLPMIQKSIEAFRRTCQSC